jgi:cell envelope opacity-associated protein A
MTTSIGLGLRWWGKGRRFVLVAVVPVQPLTYAQLHARWKDPAEHPSQHAKVIVKNLRNAKQVEGAVKVKPRD